MRRRLVTCSIVLTIGGLWGAAPGYADEPASLRLLRAWPVDGMADLQPSGLASCRGALLTVGDKHDRTVFQLQLNANGATAKRFLKLPELAPPAGAGVPGTRRLTHRMTSWVTGTLFDWEGLACGPDETLWLVSEAYAAVLRVPPAGRPQWVEAPVYSVGREAGLFSALNGVVEGVALLHEDLVLAAERDPRGIVTLISRAGKWEVDQAMIMDDSIPPPPSGRQADFGDAYASHGALYTLERNAHAICRRDTRTFRAQRCWSYAKAENDAARLYRDARHGLAEGMTVHEGKLYVILDNNNDARRSDARDRRPQLFEFELPADWSGSAPP